MDDKQLDDFFRDRIGSIEQDDFDAAALDALVPELVALNRRVAWYATAWAWLWQGGRGFYFLIMAGLAYMLWMQQGQLGEMEMRMNQLTVQPDTVWMVNRDTIWREIPAAIPPSPVIIYRKIPDSPKALAPTGNLSLIRNSTPAQSVGVGSGRDDPNPNSESVAIENTVRPNPDSSLSSLANSIDMPGTRKNSLLGDSTLINSQVATSQHIRDSLIVEKVDSVGLEVADNQTSTALPKPKKERKPWFPHFQIQTGLYGMGWNGKVDVGKGEGFSAGGVEAVFMLDEHIGIFTAPGIASFRYEIESEAQGTYQLDAYPPLVPGEPLPDLHEVKMNGSALIMPIGLRYMMSPIGLLTPYVNGGLVGRKFISQEFTYEIIENGQELRRSVAGGPDTWKWASLYGSLGAQYRLGNFHPFLSLNYQKDFTGQGIEGRQYRLIGIQGGFLYRIK